MGQYKPYDGSIHDDQEGKREIVDLLYNVGQDLVEMQTFVVVVAK